MANGLVNAVEIETTNILSKSEKIAVTLQNLKELKLESSWNFDNHLLFKNGHVGDVVELRISTSSPSTQYLVLHATKSRDFGILRLTVNGKMCCVWNWSGKIRKAKVLSLVWIAW